MIFRGTSKSVQPYMYVLCGILICGIFMFLHGGSDGCTHVIVESVVVLDAVPEYFWPWHDFFGQTRIFFDSLVLATYVRTFLFLIRDIADISICFLG